MAGDDRHLVLLYELVGLLLADLGPLLVILVDDLDGLAGHLAPQVIERQLDRVAHVVADDGSGTGQRRDVADRDLVLRQCGAGRQAERAGERSRVLEHSGTSHCRAVEMPDGLTAPGHSVGRGRTGAGRDWAGNRRRRVDANGTGDVIRSNSADRGYAHGWLR